MNPTGRITVPAEARRAIGLDGEALFEVEVDRGAIVLRPVAVVPLSTVRDSSKARRRKV